MCLVQENYVKRLAAVRIVSLDIWWSVNPVQCSCKGTGLWTGMIDGKLQYTLGERVKQDVLFGPLCVHVVGHPADMCWMKHVISAVHHIKLTHDSGRPLHHACTAFGMAFPMIIRMMLQSRVNSQMLQQSFWFCTEKIGLLGLVDLFQLI